MRWLRCLVGTLACGLAGAAWGAPPRIDVAFVVDATGSMGPWIREARTRIKDIAADLAAGDPPPDVRFGLVRFRDLGDAFVTEAVPFTADIDQMRAALDATQAQGGGDTPEAVLEGLLVGLRTLDWRDDDGVLRLLYLVGDAPPQTGAGRPLEADVLREALQRRVVIHSIACGHMDRPGQAFFERVARLSEGRAFRLEGLGARPRAAVAARSGAGAAATGSLAEAVSGSARDYADSLGVGFDPAARRAPLAAEPLGVAAVAESGLRGALLRPIEDPGTWADLWRAHLSQGAADTPPPAVDFSRHAVLALGGADAGLALVALSGDGAARVAEVAPASPGVRFVQIPAAKTPLFVVAAKGGAR